MKGRPYKILSLAIHDLLHEKLTRMNCWDDLTASGGATRSLGNVSKEPDQVMGTEQRGLPNIYS